MFLFTLFYFRCNTKYILSKYTKTIVCHDYNVSKSVNCNFCNGLIIIEKKSAKQTLEN